jgi:DnaJ-class molecular chaperone
MRIVCNQCGGSGKIDAGGVDNVEDCGRCHGDGDEIVELLTDLERLTIDALGNVWNALCSIVGNDGSRLGDLGEAVVHIHALQHMIMAQAAARAYPNEYRQLGLVKPQQQGEPA